MSSVEVQQRFNEARRSTRTKQQVEALAEAVKAAIAGGDLTAEHGEALVAGLRRDWKRLNTGHQRCTRCGGKGVIEHPRDNGLCYKCFGSGFSFASIDAWVDHEIMAANAWKRHLMSQQPEPEPEPEPQEVVGEVVEEVIVEEFDIEEEGEQIPLL